MLVDALRVRVQSPGRLGGCGWAPPCCSEGVMIAGPLASEARWDSLPVQCVFSDVFSFFCRCIDPRVVVVVRVGVGVEVCSSSCSS